MPEPAMIEGGLTIDGRGVLSYVNGCDLQSVRRFYVVRNHRVGYVRAWHGHRQESKWITVLAGTALVGVVALTPWAQPDPHSPVRQFVLSSWRPAVLRVPAGYANTWMALSEGTIMLHFSDRRLGEAGNADCRLPVGYFGETWR